MDYLSDSLASDSYLTQITLPLLSENCQNLNTRERETEREREKERRKPWICWLTYARRVDNSTKFSDKQRKWVSKQASQRKKERKKERKREREREKYTRVDVTTRFPEFLLRPSVMFPRWLVPVQAAVKGQRQITRHMTNWIPSAWFDQLMAARLNEDAPFQEFPAMISSTVTRISPRYIQLATRLSGILAHPSDSFGILSGFFRDSWYGSR